MTTPEGTEPTREPRRARKGQSPPIDISPRPSSTDRLDAMTRGRIDALEKDKRRLQVEVAGLQARVDQLGPENARLLESLDNAQANNTLSTVLIAVGGFSVSYATFTGQAAMWANASAGCLLAGIVMLIWQVIRRRRKG